MTAETPGGEPSKEAFSPAESRLRAAFERREPIQLEGETVRAEIIAELVTSAPDEGRRRSLKLTVDIPLRSIFASEQRLAETV
ncbi:hypothetical protein ACH347_11455 [Saccharopolyspora sp. 5N102]|uniref:hypothetical protein n=1 Tax=Saccharopolyspora sp. 5N102 TaxID=3375155 RepID=UPI00379D0E2D